MEYLHVVHFSLEEARSMLDQVSGLVDEMASLKQQLDAIGYDVYRHQYFGGSGPNGDRFFPLLAALLIFVPLRRMIRSGRE